MTYKINFFWDGEAFVWVATSDDIPGLVLEDESFEALIREVQLAVPTLITLNNMSSDTITLDFFANRQEQLVYNG